mmetsp:Transcript_25430/g.38241  ORF Transcript_25430/g.38241 Transcript_25430/m.38241 type:complete len:253 (+) Transcript_25430:283-1041(+)
MSSLVVADRAVLPLRRAFSRWACAPRSPCRSFSSAILSWSCLMSSFRCSKSTTSRSELVNPCRSRSAAASALSASRWCLARPRRSRSPASCASSSRSASRRPAFSASTNFSFSFMCVSTSTVFWFFRRSLCNSSFLSSIFSVCDWFSMRSCSKSIKCKPSASCSFALSLASNFFSAILRLMFLRRTFSVSSSFACSVSSNCSIIFPGSGFPVRLFSAPSAISRLKARNWAVISCALPSLSSSLACRSSAVWS